MCWVTYAEHKTHLAVAFRRVHNDLYEEMLRCRLDQLCELGWQRYHRVGLTGCYQL